MRETSPYAGQTVTIRGDARDIGGLPAVVADWYVNTGQHVTWEQALAAGDFRAQSYANRRAQAALPDDDDVLLARVDGMNMLIHVTEISGYQAPITAPTAPAPAPVSDSEIGVPCPACLVPLATGDMVAVLLLGPGADPVARAAALAGEAYDAVAVEMHWACRTGDETYQLAEA